MQRIIWILVLAILGWYAWGKYEAQVKAQRAAEAVGQWSNKLVPATSSKPGDQGVSFFTCDGRNTCAQMTSCEEARYFAKNCPGLSSEVTGEGIASCEKQWCTK